MLRSLVGRHRPRVVLVAALVISGTLLAIDGGTQTEVARALGATLYAPIQALVQGAEEMVQLRRENRQLRRVVATLNLERMRLLQLRDERLQMQRLAGFAAERFPLLIPSEVVGRSTDPMQDMLQLACGTDDSVRVDMPVAAYGGLVGRLRQVTRDHALAEILTSPGLAVSCRDQRSGVIGILRPAHGDLLLDRVDAVEDVLVGDPLVTSGLGGVYPRGIPVGVVIRVENSLDGLFKRVEVRPYVDLGGLQEVFVVRRQVTWEDTALYGPEDREVMGTATRTATANAGGR